ncbi:MULTISPECIES: 1-phosphofructokinase family hexose kinase [unclassified Nocardioides]|uniref:1-phosphofructokinase family hexose kinase n=1 Tax=unclassified Nocardioides TaxID=2615069 RepID=UPI00361F26E2
MSPIRCVALSPAVDITYEALADGPLRLGGVNRPTTVHRRAGGKAANVARVVTALGGRSVLAAVVAGPTGRWYAEAAKAEGLDLDLVEADRGETRLCVTVLGEPAPTELYEPSAAPGHEAWAELVGREAAAEAAWTVVSGSAPPGIGAGDLALLVGAAARHRPVALDAHGSVVAEALAQALPLRVLKVNRDEAAGLLGRPRDTDAERLCAGLASYADCPVVVVTCGADGAVAVDESRTPVRVEAGPLGPHPTGSGDAFLAALVLALSQEEPLGVALERAGAAGTANAHAPTAGDVSRISPSGP